MNNKIILLFFLMFNFSYSNQQEINREERRKQEKEVRELEKYNTQEEVQLHKIEKKAPKSVKKLRMVFIDGNTILEYKKIEKIKNKHLMKKDGGSIINLMKDLENAYLKKGYISVRVKINTEKSNLQDGVVYLKVIEGVLEDIQFKDKRNRGRLKIFTSFPVSKGNILNINDLDQGIDNLNSVSSNNAKLDILPGKSLGGSIIEIDNQKFKRVSGTINYNNLGQDFTGKDRVKLSLMFEDILGVNDSFMVSYQQKLGWEIDEDNDDFSFFFKIPVKYWEFSISRSQSEYLSAIESFNHIYESTGVSTNINYSVRRIVNRNSKGKTSIGMTLTEKDTKNYFDGIKLITGSRKLSILKTDLNHNRRFLGGILSGNLAYHEGLDRFGAKSDEDNGVFSPKAQFQKYTANLNWYKPFVIKKQNLLYRFTFSGQYTDDILYSSESMNIGDDTTIRGFRNDSSSGDKGFYLRNELGYRYTFFEPFIGYDYGRVKSVFKDEYYKKSGDKMSGATIGVKVYLNYFDMSLSYSKPLTAPSYIEKNTHELYFTTSIKF
ncbi:ShlB/FhaC/HecB family hemolysin secretion/activation protein [Fusobacteria bacterium ZRK30]|nr:ShlB/FhaC/HecB family hemolysin secretion/activation protein [Fusobacteria bacterium ZRK30]